MHKKKMSIATSFFIILFDTIVLVSAVAILSSSLSYPSFLSHRYQMLSQTVSETVLGYVDDGDAQNYLSGRNNAKHIELGNNIKNLKQNIPYIDNIFVFQVTPKGLYTIYESNSTSIRGGLGEFTSFSKEWTDYRDKLIAGEVVTKARGYERSGITLFYCKPIYKDVYVAVGVSEALITSEKDNFRKNISLSVGLIGAMILIITSMFINKKVVRGIRKIKLLLKKTFETAPLGMVEEITQIDINSNSLLENIYRSFVKIYTAKVRLDAILGLMKRMDNFTMEHIDNSLRYTILLVNEMRKLTKYKELITDRDFENLILATPLHDVGKLAIPHEIMFKPGKFTTEEYNKSKNHALLGSRIIEEMYLKESKEDYLELARILALNHHERWDGTGYPKGLKGDEIPLFARILSVCDVFDALLSKRVYKGAYSFDKSFEIIMEEKARMFDPDIVSVFFASKEQLHNLHKEISTN
ncbi:MAG: HD domain-containing protein [Eubacteriales bacterium]|nr:HD domain-containing protein [Eubacteriales bacterium]